MKFLFIQRVFAIGLIIFLLLSACAPSGTPASKQSAEQQPATLSPTPEATGTALVISPSPTPTPETPTLTSTPDLRPDPADWQNWPVVPTVSAAARAIYQRGISAGNDPRHFSKVGDCQNINTYFLSIFDNPDQYRLDPDHTELPETILHFSGSFSRESVATSGGMNVASVLSNYWADQDLCESKESPLACELRLHKPSIVLISMEESWGRNNKVENYEKYMRRILQTVIDSGALPVLATKADNLEGNHLINQTIARLAYEYDIPLWNFWLAVQPLPQHGLLDDGFHLTHGLNYFDERKNLKQGWPIRNLTALQVLNAVWRQASQE